MCYIFDTMKKALVYSFSFLFFLFLLIMLTGCFQSPKLKNPMFSLLVNSLLKHDVEEITVEELQSLNNLPILLDTRSKAEYETSHIPGAIWVGYEAFDIKSLENIPTDEKIVLYCSIGYRSEEITRKINAAGYKQTSNLYGGIFEWVNKGGMLENHEQKETHTLHVYKKVWGIWTSAKEKVF